MVKKIFFIILFTFLALLIKQDSVKGSKKEFIMREGIKEAYLAGGCFWGMEEYLRRLDGVLDTEVGFIGGKEKINVNYLLVRTGLTDFAEAVRVRYDSNKITYEAIIRYFFRIHDPTTLNRQGNDIGKQYRSTVFTSDVEEMKIIQNLINKIDKTDAYKNKIVTTIEPLGSFYEAEDYHQDYLKKNPNGYSCHLLRPDFKF